ncbi:hypothetical protein DFH08DRAFT_821943 [Mycena albidolilacea]|uniref:Uncharacterized protein n=1 Tax=Mycena albidolilacea TaxID=1033008 RepID=A0AAD6Z9J7_9AGAR|nr:hypothetical protein DFH08DRAFT_821943 [Mycena albidolilacea]
MTTSTWFQLDHPKTNVPNYPSICNFSRFRKMKRRNITLCIARGPPAGKRARLAVFRVVVVLVVFGVPLAGLPRLHELDPSSRSRTKSSTFARKTAACVSEWIGASSCGMCAWACRSILPRKGGGGGYEHAVEVRVWSDKGGHKKEEGTEKILGRGRRRDAAVGDAGGRRQSGKDRNRERDLRNIVTADCHQTQAQQRKRQYLHRRPANSHPQHPSHEYTKSQKRREGDVIRHPKKGNRAPRAQNESGAEARKATRTRGAGIRKKKKEKEGKGKWKQRTRRGANKRKVHKGKTTDSPPQPPSCARKVCAATTR